MPYQTSLHSWRVTPREAMEIQARLARRVIMQPSRGRARYVAGVDTAFSRDGSSCLAGAVLWDNRRREVIGQSTVADPVRFPYVPGLLSFREAPAILKALEGLPRVPDMLMVDGHGLAHPRRFGIASHLGVITDLPAIGCGKSRLIGSYDSFALRRGRRSRLIDNDEVIGAVLCTREGVKPIFVSVGHRIDLDTAVRLVRRCAVRYRLPEPVRQADRLVAREKRDRERKSVV